MPTKQKIYGFSIVEVLLAVSILALIITTLFGGIIYGQQTTQVAGSTARASIIANEGLEAVRNIRDHAFSNLVDGTYGLAITSNTWGFSGSSDTTDTFTRSITISTIDADSKQIVSNVTWTQNQQRTGLVSLTTYLTAWKASAGSPTSCVTICQNLLFSSGICRTDLSQCTLHSEINEPTGDAFCTAGTNDTCCCKP